jgi:hypothetical protein
MRLSRQLLVKPPPYFPPEFLYAFNWIMATHSGKECGWRVT